MGGGGLPPAPERPAGPVPTWGATQAPGTAGSCQEAGVRRCLWRRLASVSQAQPECPSLLGSRLPVCAQSLTHLGLPPLLPGQAGCQLCARNAGPWVTDLSAHLRPPAPSTAWQRAGHRVTELGPPSSDQEGAGAAGGEGPLAARFRRCARRESSPCGTGSCSAPTWGGGPVCLPPPGSSAEQSQPGAPGSPHPPPCCPGSPGLRSR